MTTPADVPPAEWVSAGASVASAATDDHPLRLELTLTNETAGTLALRDDSNRPLVYFPEFEGPSGTAVLVPRENERVRSNATSHPTEGCWRFVTPESDPAHVGIMSGLGPVAVDPGATLSVEHDVYYRGDPPECFPSGEYKGATVVDLSGTTGNDDGPFVVLKYALGFRSAGPPTVTVGDPEECDAIRPCNAERLRYLGREVPTATATPRG